MIGQRAVLTARALCGFASYDVINVCFGFRRIRTFLARSSGESRRACPDLRQPICDAVNLAACFYFKPVRCLQRSAVTVGLLRRYGIACRLVIAYRPSPFFAHAWVEIDGQTANDSPGYADRLKVLCRL